MNSAAIVFGAQRFVNALILVALLACAVMFCQDPSVDSYLYAVMFVLGFWGDGCPTDWRSGSQSLFRS